MTTAPRHTQLMDPADDPEEFIAASIYWYPLLFPSRTEVLDHLFLVGGNGYRWGADGKIRSVFAHIEPDYDSLDHYETDARKYVAEAEGDEVMRGFLLKWAARERAEHARLLAIREDYQHLARTYGPVRVREQDLSNPGGYQARMITSRDLAWTLLGTAPEHVDPRWQVILDEARELFAPILIEQGTLF